MKNEWQQIDVRSQNAQVTTHNAIMFICGVFGTANTYYLAYIVILDNEVYTVIVMSVGQYTQYYYHKDPFNCNTVVKKCKDKVPCI